MAGRARFDPLPPGTYVVTESRTQGYALTTIVCEDPGGGTTVDVAAGTATVALAGGETVTCTFTNTPAPEADLEIEKSVDEEVIAPGDTVIYTLTVTNLGPDTAEGVVVTDELPDGLTVISYPDECVLTGTTLTCDIGDLAAGDSVSLEVEVTVDDTGLFRNVTSVDSTTPDPDPDNNDSSAEVLAAETTPQTAATEPVEYINRKKKKKNVFRLSHTHQCAKHGVEASEKDYLAGAGMLARASASGAPRARAAARLDSTGFHEVGDVGFGVTELGKNRSAVLAERRHGVHARLEPGEVERRLERVDLAQQDLNEVLVVGRAGRDGAAHVKEPSHASRYYPRSQVPRL